MSDLWANANLVTAAIEHAYNAVVITDADTHGGGPHVLLCNPAFQQMTGYTLDELRGRNLRMLQGAATDPQVIDRMRRCLQTGEFFEGATVNYRRDGTPYHVQWNISPVRDDSGAITNFVSIQQDISARLAAQAERDMLAKALQAAGDPIFVTDTQHRILHANQAFADVSGYSLSEARGSSPAILYESTASASTYEDMTQALDRGEAVRSRMTLRTRDGKIVHIVHTATPFADAQGGYGHINTFTDITDLEHRAEHYRTQAMTDFLTGLANRAAAEAEIRMSLRTCRRAGEPLSVVLADVDHFKQVNDVYGHATGDHVLRQVAEVLRATVRESDTPARWGGEEFLVLLPNAGIGVAADIADRLRLGVTSAVDGLSRRLTVSAGVAEARQTDTAATLMARADAALYAAKDSGRNRVVKEADP